MSKTWLTCVSVSDRGWQGRAMWERGLHGWMSSRSRCIQREAFALRPRYQGPRTTPVETSNHLHWVSEGDPACHLRGSEHYVVMNILVLLSKALFVLACLSIFVLHSILFFWGPGHRCFICWPTYMYHNALAYRGHNAPTRPWLGWGSTYGFICICGAVWSVITPHEALIWLYFEHISLSY